jgi:hypothetical protein
MSTIQKQTANWIGEVQKNKKLVIPLIYLCSDSIYGSQFGIMNHKQPENSLKKDWWLGIAHSAGDAMTYFIETEQDGTSNLVHYSYLSQKYWYSIRICE